MEQEYSSKTLLPEGKNNEKVRLDVNFIDRKNVIYGELKKFEDHLKELNMDELVDLFIVDNNTRQVDIIKTAILSIFPETKNHYEINFVDKDYRECVITALNEQDIPVFYLAYNGDFGLMNKVFHSYDQALIGLVCYKYCMGLSSASPHYWIFRMLNMFDDKSIEESLKKEQYNSASAAFKTSPDKQEKE